MAQLFITELLKELKVKYTDLLDDAVEFFNEYDALYGVYAKETERIQEIDSQLDTIIKYKQEYGVFPHIKEQENTEKYMEELYKIKEKAEKGIRIVEPEVLKGFDRRRVMIDDIAKDIANSMVREKDASKFIATMMLRAPQDTDHNRCLNNERNKPIYIAALTICLLKRLTKKQMIEEEFITSRIPVLVPSEDNPEHMEPHPEMVKDYKESVMIPIIRAVLIHHIGSYSVEADKIFKGNRYGLLEEEDRKNLIKVIYTNSLNYFKYAIGRPQEKDYSRQDAEQYEIDVQKFELTEHILNHYPKPQDPLGNILRIPMIYSSFILSTKPKHDFRLVFKAYDILKSGIEKGIIFKPYADEFLKMVGRYPLGSGIFFNSLESNVPERAVEIGLNPPRPSSAIVKQLTRRQVKFDDHTQVAVSKDYILSNEEARKKSNYGPEYYKKQFPKGYFWNPSEPWERDIDHVRFWRRDNKLKMN